MRLELIDTIEFESILQRRIQELYLKLKNQTTIEFDALTNERDMLESILVACQILNTETKYNPWRLQKPAIIFGRQIV